MVFSIVQIKFYIAILITSMAGGILEYGAPAPYTVLANSAVNNQSRISKAETLYSKAKLAIKERKFRAASGFLDQAIAIIGDTYISKNTDDDTDMILTLAKIEQSKQHYQKAVNLKKKVLESRLELLRSR